MKFAFRADASLDIGTGHVMRCLTLARALRDRGHECIFMCREHIGNLISFIRDEGFAVCALPMGHEQDSDLAHAHWLSASQAEDASACKALTFYWQPDWLVVDHYALDHRWEVTVTPGGCRLLVIDDLADRSHKCDLLLDQNLGRDEEQYHPLLLQRCDLLIGPRYALLRPEFFEARKASLARRGSACLKEVLIALGGVDQHNHTQVVLDALQRCKLPAEICFTVILGATAPYLKEVESVAKECPWPVQVLSGVKDISGHMMKADLAIGAGGGTSWERCCLGLPTLLVILAENQRSACRALFAKSAAMMIELDATLDEQLQGAFSTLSDCQVLENLANAASRISDGLGVQRVINILECP